MFFTQEDYNKIYEYIRRRGIKDTEFGVSSPLDGTELISLVQKGNNVKTTLSNFLASFRTSNFINVTEIGSNPSGKYTLEEAIREIKKPARVGGCLITFIDKETNDWKVYQFLGKDKDDWYDLEYWRDILGITEKKFKGAFISEEALYNTVKAPEVGDYAFVGTSIGESVVYVCKTRFVWSSTTEKATEYLTVLIQGTVTVGPNGNWFNNGEDTGIPAKGEKGDKPYFKFNATTGNVEYSFNQTDWEVLVNKEEITGAAATIKIGEIIYKKGIHPKVENSGTQASAILDFELPDTNSIIVGNTTTTSQGTKAKVINSGTAYDAVLEFSIPQGQTGPKGDKGDGWTMLGFKDTVESLPSSATLGDTYMVGTTTPYNVYMYNGSSFVNVGTATEIKAGVIDGGRADTLYGGARVIDCGGAE